MTRRIVGCLLLLMMFCIALGGCAQPAATRVDSPLLIGHADATRLGYNVAWASHVNIPSSQNLAHVLVYEDLVITTEEPENLVTALSTRDGSILWRKVVGSRNDKMFPPARTEELLLLNTQYQLFIIDIRTGKLREIHPLETIASTGGSVVDNLIVFGGTNGRVFAHNLDTGYTRWAYQMAGPIIVRPVATPPYVFVADSKGHYALFDSLTGELNWRRQTFGRISAQPDVNRLGLLVASEDHSLYAINRTSGVDRWIFRTPEPLTEDPITLGNNVYLPIPSQGLVAIDLVRGRELWRMQTDAQPILVRDGRLLLNNRTSLMVLDAATGKLQLEVPVQRIQTAVEGPNNTLFLVSRNGRILRLNPS